MSISSKQFEDAKKHKNIPGKVKGLTDFFDQLDKLQELYQIAKKVGAGRTNRGELGIKENSKKQSERYGDRDSYTAFISYSWDSPEHKQRIREVANRLNCDGGEIWMDAFEYPVPERWDIWMEKKIKNADFVLIIFTKNYKKRFDGEEDPHKGLGVTWEARIIRSIIYQSFHDNKFIPVVCSATDKEHIPSALFGKSVYTIDDKESFEDLTYHLNGIPCHVMSERGKKRKLQPQEAGVLEH